MIQYKQGSILDSEEDYICHQVNCQGVMGSGLAKQIRDKWPFVYKHYRDAYLERQEKIDELCGEFGCQIDVSETLLGHLQKVNINARQTVVNMFAQQYYGVGGRYTSYDAFWTCLGGIRDSAPKGSSIAFPVGIGCGLGGANWQVIKQMIIEVLNDDYLIVFYEYTP